MAKKKRLKIVLDTNWYVSASINRNSRRRLYDLVINENLTIFYSRELLAEYESVIFRKKFEKYIRPEQASRFISLALTRLTQVEIKTLVRLSRDAKDNFLLSMCIDCDANYRATGDPIESNLFLIIRMDIFTALVIGIFVKNYRFDVAITSIMFLVLLFFFIQDLSPNTTVLKIQIDSGNLQKRELIWRNMFVQIDNDTLTSYAIDPNNGRVVVSDKPFTIGNKIRIKIVRKLDAPIEFNFIQKNENFSIPLNKTIHVDTEPE